MGRTEWLDYIEGVICRHNRVVGYALILVTDTYPPFCLRDGARLLSKLSPRLGWPILVSRTSELR
jgi:hypothetical protein